jgi:hypothetical protein
MTKQEGRKANMELSQDVVDIIEKIIEGQKLNCSIEEFEEKSDKRKWSIISRYQFLSEDFMRKFEDKLDWYWISRYQKLSEDFIREFHHKIDLFRIFYSGPKLSTDFLYDFRYELNDYIDYTTDSLDTWENVMKPIVGY